MYNRPIYRLTPFRTSFVSSLKTIFSTEVFISAYEVLNYTVDLYMPKHNIVIDYNEPRKRETPEIDRAAITRARTIIEHLNCTFIRVKHRDDINTLAGQIYGIIHKADNNTIAAQIDNTSQIDNAGPSMATDMSLEVMRVPISHQHIIRVPAEIVLLIILAAREGNSNDIHALRALSLACRSFYSVLHIYHKEIIEHYTIRTEVNGEIKYKLYGKLHSIKGEPAITSSDGSRRWFKHGRLHRDEDKPAIVLSDNRRLAWYKRGELHRDGDEPAEVWRNGCRVWAKHGKLHRDNDKPAVVSASGRCEWWIYGQRVK